MIDPVSLILRRASDQLSQNRLVVDFYRIRRRLAYPLPVREESFPEFPTRLGTWYPWDCWLAWAIEERVWNLGWAGTWNEDQNYRNAVEQDLCGLATWKYACPDQIDGLAVAHFVRTLIHAARHWPWLSAETRNQIDQGLKYQLAFFSDWLAAEHRWWQRRKQEPNHEDFASPLHNIHFIQTVGLCLAARWVGHADAHRLESRTSAFCKALLDQHAGGVSEGVGYDGYILDFMMDWLQGAPANPANAILSHTELEMMLDQSAIMAAPGNVSEVAKLGDVEPLEMPFHISALAKYRRIRSNLRWDWLLDRYDPSRMRTEALMALKEGPALNRTMEPAAGSATRCARVLRSGWTVEDLAVAVSVHQGRMGHLHFDNGSIVIAAGGNWMIDDPGYQQYMPTSEREFSAGADAHNAPLPDGHPQSARAGAVAHEPMRRENIWKTTIDLTGCYDNSIALCRRHLWLVDRRMVVVADEVKGDFSKVGYHWHGHPRAAWWAQDGLALVYLDRTELWIRCMSQKLQQNQIDRRRGSRGQLTLCASIDRGASNVIWWVFGVDRQLIDRVVLDGDQLSATAEPWRLCCENEQ